MNPLYNQMLLLSDKIKQRKQNNNNQQQKKNNNVLHKNKIGCALYSIQIPQINHKQLNNQFINKILKISPHQFDKSFRSYFPFFMLDFIKLYTRIQKHFKSISYKQQQFLIQKHKYCLNYDKLLKNIFQNDNNAIISKQKWNQIQLNQITKNQSKMIFKHMIQSTLWDLSISIVQVNILKDISHVDFNVLKSLKIHNSPIKSLEPIMWMHLPQLEVIQIGLLCTTSIKPLARCNLDSLTQIQLQFMFQYHQNRMYQTKKSIDMSPLSRTKVKQSFSKQNQICSSPLYLYDPRQLVKLEWNQFKYPSVMGRYYIYDSFVTYQLTQHQQDVIDDRAQGYIEQRIRKQLRIEVTMNETINFGEKMIQEVNEKDMKAIMSKEQQIQYKEKQQINRDNCWEQGLNIQNKIEQQVKQNKKKGQIMINEIQQQDKQNKKLNRVENCELNGDNMNKYQEKDQQQEVNKINQNTKQYNMRIDKLQNIYIVDRAIVISEDKIQYNQRQQNKQDSLKQQNIQIQSQQQDENEQNQSQNKKQSQNIQQNQKQSQNIQQNQKQQVEMSEQQQMNIIQQQMNMQQQQQQVEQQQQDQNIDIQQQQDNDQQQQFDDQYDLLQFDRPQVLQAVQIGKLLFFNQQSQNNINQQIYKIFQHSKENYQS